MGKRVYSSARPGLPVKGIVFDMDGVLFDTEKDSVERIIRLGKQLGFDISREMVITNMGRNMAEESRIYREILGERFYGDQFWGLYWQERNRQYEEEGIPVKESAVKLLKIARNAGLPCAVASSSPSGEVCKSLINTGLDSYISCIIGGDMFEKSKPSPDIFRIAEQEMNLPPEELAYVGDTISRDVLGTRAAGWKCMIQISNPSIAHRDVGLDPEANRPDYLISDLSEIPAIIARENVR